jgi:DNA-binding CsgD family transcriptional regulator
VVRCMAFMGGRVRRRKQAGLAVMSSIMLGMVGDPWGVIGDEHNPVLAERRTVETRAERAQPRKSPSGKDPGDPINGAVAAGTGRSAPLADFTETMGNMGVVQAMNGEPLAGDASDELKRVLGDLADRIESAVQILRALVEVVNPSAQMEDLRLTPREMEILTALGAGLSNAEIAARCWISENTVKFHVKNLFKKLNVRDRGQAIMLAKAIHRRLDLSTKNR